MLSTLAGRERVMWRDRKAGYVEIDPQAALQTALAEREARYDAEAAKWAEIETAATVEDLPAATRATEAEGRGGGFTCRRLTPEPDQCAQHSTLNSP